MFVVAGLLPYLASFSLITFSAADHTLDIEALGIFRPSLFLISGVSGCLAEGLWGFFVTPVSILDIYA